MQLGEKRSSSLPLLFVCLVALLAGGYAWLLSHETNQLYEGINASLHDEQTISTTVEIGDDTVTIPSYSLFRDQQLWQYISNTRGLPEGFTPDELVPVEVPHGDSGTTYQIDADTRPALKQLFAAALRDGLELMLSSAYRSVQEQQATYNTLLSKQGSSYVSQYVATPGHSEHQTGLAVDITTASAQCAADSYQCLITRPVVEWLQAHAADYGFIQRYPSGKQSITGTASEEWHYRYVGIPLARALTKANLTFDEFVQQVAPGYATER